MKIRILLATALLGACALCGCATIANSPSKSVVASADCADPAAAGNAVNNDACSAPGRRSYSESQLRSTGKTSAGEALALLDPAVTVRH
jgi:hypothetical protein